MDKIFVAQRVVNKLMATEAAVDSALVEASELMSEMLKARKDVEAPLSFADDAQVKLAETMRALSEARSSMVVVHKQLAEAKLRLGIRTKLNGENTLDVPRLSESNGATLRNVG